MAHISLNTPTNPGLSTRLFQTMGDLKTRYTRYRLFRTTLVEMQALSDRELADLGLSRCMLRRAAYEAAYG